jgi:hypothetical protein
MNDIFFEYNNTIKIVVNERPLRKESVHFIVNAPCLIEIFKILIQLGQVCYAINEKSINRIFINKQEIKD